MSCPYLAVVADGHRAGEDPSVLQVLEVDLCVEANTKLHHTDEYEITQEESNTFRRQQPQLVTRRGQPFDIKIKFNRAYDSSKDDLKLIFEIGENILSNSIIKDQCNNSLNFWEQTLIKMFED